MQSIYLLADACRSFKKYCVDGITPNHKQIETYLSESLMLVTALNPVIGYDKAAEIAKKAHNEGTTLKEACLALGYLNDEEFNSAVDPSKMVGH